MSFIARSRRNNLWFGTEDRMLFFPTPNRGADVSPAGWGDGGTLLNGGGYQLNSFGSHKNYIFEWPSSSSREVAQLMKSYADGTYGRGLIYFVDPLIYTTNIFPAKWADPSISLGYEGASLVYGVDPVAFPTSNWQANNLPVRSAFYDVGGVSSSWRGKQEAVFLPLPEGFDLHLGAIFETTGLARLFYRTQAQNGALGAIQNFTSLPADTPVLSSEVISGGVAGVWVWAGKTGPGVGTILLSALSARLVPSGSTDTSLLSGPWIGGQGHSGVRFNGKPTYINNTGVNDGQIGFAASFIEVGDWVYG